MTCRAAPANLYSILPTLKGSDMGPGFTHIACCIEGSPAQEAVIAAGIRLLAETGGTMSLVHAITQPITMMATPAPDMTDMFDAAKTWMGDAVNDAQHAITAAGISATVDGVLLEGHPGISITDWAKRSHVDLIIAASHRGHFDRALLGSFATYVAYHAPCDVHLVRPGTAPPA
jgi:nucleotide-binding universal stress UspA family protein